MNEWAPRKAPPTPSGHQREGREAEIGVEVAFTTARSAECSGAPARDDAIGSPGDWKWGEMEVEEQFESASEDAGRMAWAGQNVSFHCLFLLSYSFRRRRREGEGVALQ